MTKKPKETHQEHGRGEERDHHPVDYHQQTS
jgi:hypothetical protein